MTLGERIARLRAAAGLSQGELAEALEVSRQSVSKWETGASVPELDKLVGLSQVFGVSLDQLVKGEDAPAPDTVPAAPLPARPGLPLQQTVGVVLLAFGLLAGLLLFLFSGDLVGLVLGLPFVVCGLICMAAKAHPGLKCAWAAWLMVELYLRAGTGLNWSVALLTFQWEPYMNYTRLAIAWVMLLIPLALGVWTVWAYRRAKPPFHARPLPLGVGWALLGLFWFLRVRLATLLAQRFFSPTGQRVPYGEFLVFLTRVLGDWLFLAGACCLLVWTLGVFRARRTG